MSTQIDTLSTEDDIKEIISEIRDNKLKKIQSDTQAQQHNSEKLNKLSKCLINLFFTKKMCIFWVCFYIFLYCAPELVKIKLFEIKIFEFIEEYIDLIALLKESLYHIGLFFIVFVLGKFLKDSLMNFLDRKIHEHKTLGRKCKISN